MSDTPNLASILGLDKKKPGIDVKELKTVAYLRYKDLLDGDDIDAQMAAFDDYIALRDLEDTDG